MNVSDAKDETGADAAETEGGRKHDDPSTDTQSDRRVRPLSVQEGGPERREEDTRVKGCGHRTIEALKSVGPVNAPLPWLVANATWFLMSVVLLVLTSIPAFYKRHERDLRLTYVIYNSLSTLSWTAESFLHTLHFGICFWRHHDTVEGFKRALELVLAAYFLVDSIVVLIEWENDESRESSMLVDLIINVLAFGYAVREVWMLRRAKMDGSRPNVHGVKGPGRRDEGGEAEVESTIV